MKNIKWWPVTSYKIKELGPYNYFLDMKVERNKELHTIWLLQEGVINKELVAVNMENYKRVSIPIVTAHNPTKNPKKAGDEVLVRSYQSHCNTDMIIYMYTTVSKYFSFDP